MVGSFARIIFFSYVVEEPYLDMLRTPMVLEEFRHAREHVNIKSNISVCASISKLSWRRTQPYAVVSSAVVRIVFGGAPYGATKRVRGGPKRGWRPHVSTAIGALGGAPYGATKHVKGVPKRG